MSIRVPGFTPVPVHAHDGSDWDVGVEWLPRTPRLARWYRSKVEGSAPDLFGGGSDDGSGRGGGGWLGGDLGDLLAFLVVLVVLVVAVLLLVFVAIPVLLVVVDVLVLAVALVVGLALKVLLRRPWRVVARCAKGPSAGEQQVCQVVGVRAARRARDELRTAIATGGGGRAVSVLPQ